MAGVKALSYVGKLYDFICHLASPSSLTYRSCLPTFHSSWCSSAVILFLFHVHRYFSQSSLSFTSSLSSTPPSNFFRSFVPLSLQHVELCLFCFCASTYPFHIPSAQVYSACTMFRVNFTERRMTDTCNNINIYACIYVKNPLFNSLVWDSLILAQ